MPRRKRRPVKGVGREPQKWLLIMPNGRVPESVTPTRLRVGRLGDRQESLEQRHIVEHERRHRPVVEGIDELSADRGSSDVVRDRSHVLADLQPRAAERRLERRRPFSVIGKAIELEWAVLPNVLEVGGGSAVRQGPPESFFQSRRMSVGEVGRSLRQNEDRLGPLFLQSRVLRPDPRRLDGLTGLPLLLSLRRLTVLLLLSQPETNREDRPNHERQRRDEQRRRRPPPCPLHSALGDPDRAGANGLALPEAAEVVGQLLALA